MLKKKLRGIRAQCQMHLMKNVKSLYLVGGMLDERKNGSSCCRAMRIRARSEFDGYKCRFTRLLRARTTRVRIDLVAYSFRLMVVNDIPNYSRISKCPDKQLHETLHYIRYNALRGFVETHSRLCLIKIICNVLNYIIY